MILIAARMGVGAPSSLLAAGDYFKAGVALAAQPIQLPEPVAAR
jgi:hypothetical protein